jgi:hypothetical protein
LTLKIYGVVPGVISWQNQTPECGIKHAFIDYSGTYDSGSRLSTQFQETLDYELSFFQIPTEGHGI